MVLLSLCIMGKKQQKFLYEMLFQKFPDDGLGNVVRNVFDFDSYSKEVRDTLTEVLHKHGM